MEINDTSYPFCKILVLEKLNTGNYCGDDNVTNKQVSVFINKKVSQETA